jgi:hypothetical protein
MAQPTTRDEFIDYCLRRLGHPVIEINIDEDQIQDRVDDGIDIWRDYNPDGAQRLYIPIQVTQDHISNKKIDLATDSATTSFASRILSVVRVFMIGDTTSSVNFFDLKYQMRLNDLADLATGVGDLAYYEQMQQYLSLIDLKLTGTPQIDYNRYKQELLIHGDLIDGGDARVGDYIVVEMYVGTSATESKIWEDRFLKEYTTALLKRQWGENITKFDGMQLPGGITLNGRQLIDDANQELDRIRTSMFNEYDNPPAFFMG